jgi:hypothetical protein
LARVQEHAEEILTSLVMWRNAAQATPHQIISVYRQCCDKTAVVDAVQPEQYEKHSLWFRLSAGSHRMRDVGGCGRQSGESS